MTSPYLWLLCLISVIPSVLCWSLLLFVVSYVWLHGRIVRFKTPEWLIFRRRQ